MENRENYVEIVKNNIANRNIIIDYDTWTKEVQDNVWKNEMYRSYFVFRKEYKEHVNTTKSVKGYNGPCAIDFIILDIDKGNLDKEHFMGYVQQCISEMFDKGIMEEDINLWFSGNGFHLEIKNVFGLQPSKNVHERLKLTMSRHFGFGDAIYDKTRIIRSKWSLNTKTNLYKTWIPLNVLSELKYKDIELASSNKQNYLKLVNRFSDNFFSTLFVDDLVEPYLQSMVIASPTILKSSSNKTDSEVTSVVSCMQHVFNEGPIEGSRNMKLMRMSSAYKRAGVPYLVTLNGMLTWSNDTISEEEINRTVKNIYESNYRYGCDDHIMAQYCDSKCIYFKRKDYTIEIRNINQLEDVFRKYVMSTLKENSIDLKDIFNCDSYVFQPGELIIFSGDTGLGKTAFIQNIVAKCNLDTLFLSLEMNAQLIFRRFAQMCSGRTKDSISNEYKDNPDFSLEEKLKHIQIMTIAPRIDTVKKVVSEYEPKVLVIDTTDELQVDFIKGEVEQQNVIIDGLKQIAQKSNTIIIAIHHLNKNSAANNIINLHSLKGSSNIVQKADKVLMIKGNRDDIVRSIVSVKSRDSGRFEMLAKFDNQLMQFSLLKE